MSITHYYTDPFPLTTLLTLSRSMPMLLESTK